MGSGEDKNSSDKQSRV